MQKERVPWSGASIRHQRGTTPPKKRRGCTKLWVLTLECETNEGKSLITKFSLCFLHQALQANSPSSLCFQPVGQGWSSDVSRSSRQTFVTFLGLCSYKGRCAQIQLMRFGQGLQWKREAKVILCGARCLCCFYT